MAKKAKVQFECQHCGYTSPKYLGKCPNCGSWNSLVEVTIQDTDDRRVRASLTGEKTRPTKIADVVPKKEPRVKTKLGELNRVLGGGVVPGSLILIGGDPGIGKSTLLLQVSQQLAELGGKVLYVSGEESADQIKMRAERLGSIDTEFYLYAETDMHEISRAIGEIEPDYVIIDSIQTMTQPDITSVAGSVSQVRETTAELLKIAKTNGIAIFIVGHVTKEGSIAGPRMLEHMVD
ncbi:DNA repair protein RadA, partial [Enterococcus asini]